MNIHLPLWEYFINFMEISLFYLFINQKLHSRFPFPHYRLLQFSFLSVRFLAQCVMNSFSLPIFIALSVSCFLEILFTLLFFKDPALVKIFWGFMYTVICMVADYLTLSIPQIFSDISSLEILMGGNFRIPFSMLYISLIAMIIFLFYHFNHKNIILTPVQKFNYLILTTGGIFIGYFIMLLTLKVELAHSDTNLVSRMILVNLFYFVLFLSLLLYIYQLGKSKEEVLNLQLEKELHKLEELEFQNLMQITENLREIKHDMNLHLNMIHSLILTEKTEETLAYIKKYQEMLEQNHPLLSTGNHAIDCILSSKIHQAKTQEIPVDFSILIPDNFPLDALSLSSLLGNLWDNALEACQRLLTLQEHPDPYIFFYIKPFQQMILIHIENPFDKILPATDSNYLSLKNEPGHGIGLKRIRSIVDENDGNISIDTENHVFSVHIMIPMKES